MDPSNSSQKRKGGAEKIRDKKKRALLKDAESCKTVDFLFSRTKSPHQTEVKKTNEEAVDESHVTSLVLPSTAEEPVVESMCLDLPSTSDIIPGDGVATGSFVLSEASAEAGTEVLETMCLDLPSTSDIIPGDGVATGSFVLSEASAEAGTEVLETMCLDLPSTSDIIPGDGVATGSFVLSEASAEAGTEVLETVCLDLPSTSDIIPGDGVATGSFVLSEASAEAGTEVLETMCLDLPSTSDIIPGVATGSCVLSEASAEAGTEVLETEHPSCSDTVTQDTAHFFCRPSANELSTFFKIHPCQPLQNLPFKAEKAYYRTDKIQRQWLTYSVEKKCLFCTVCLAYSKPSDYSVFIVEFDNFSRTYVRVHEHERTKLHKNCVDAYIAHNNDRDIWGSLFSTAVTKRNEEVLQRRKVLERIICVVKLIGKRGLSYRGAKFESAYTLDDPTRDHGNFLDFLLAFAEFDPTLKSHLNVAIESSKRRHESSKSKDVGATSRGRGSLVTLISKTVVNYIIEIICHLIKQQIAKEVGSAELYSIQIDSTQDITATDQCSIIVRYVTDDVHERLLAVVDCHSGTGKNLFELVQKTLSAHGLDVACCVSDSTDGASNMSGQYNGFTAWLEKSSPGHIHIWCYAHVLNLVLTDTTESNSASISLFGLLQGCATFFRESYLRMDSWKEQMGKLIGPAKLSRIAMIGATRWWAKHRALKKVFGSGSYADSLFFELVSALHAIGTSGDFNPKTRFAANNYLSMVLKYDTILIAQMYLQIFALTSPLSNYLQTAGLDFIMAQTMVLSTTKSLRFLARDTDTIVKKTDLFIQQHNDKCKETVDCCIETSLPAVRAAKRKRMPGELADDEAPQDPMDKFRIEVYNVVFDQAISSMEMRFQKHGELFADFSLFDPRNFEAITSHLLKTSCRLVPKNALEKVSCMLTQYYNDLKTSSTVLADLKQELSDFARKWPTIKNSVPTEYKLLRESTAVEEVDQLQEEDQPDGSAPDSEIDLETDLQTLAQCGLSCKNCVRCAFSFLRRYNLFISTYSLVYRAYKLLLTLSVTQVACERSFSKLKLVKTAARNALTQDHLEACMLMCAERGILKDIQYEDVINILASKSAELKRLLTL